VINDAFGNNHLPGIKSYLEYAILERLSILIATGTPGCGPKLVGFEKGFDFVPGIGPKGLVNVIAEGGEKYTLIRKFLYRPCNSREE